MAAKGRTDSTEHGVAIDARLAKALNHPLRARIIAVLNERTAAPVELATILDEGLSNVSYHCRELHKLDCIEVVKREHVRGARKTTYRGTTRMFLNDATWKHLSKEARDGISVAALGEVIERASRAIDAGTFDKREDRHVITLKMELDEDGWSDVSRIIADAYRRVSEIETESINRTPDAEARLRGTVSLLSYESP